MTGLYLTSNMHPVMHLTILLKSNYQVANRKIRNVCVHVCAEGGHRVTVEVSTIFRAHAKASVSRLLMVITVHSEQKHLSRGQQEKPCLW